MARKLRLLVGSITLAMVAVGMATAGSSAATGASGGCQATSHAVLKQNAKDATQVKQLIGNTNFTPEIKTFTPEPTATKHFTGYETIVVKSPKGTTSVVGSFSLTGAERCSVVITSAQIVLSRNAYVVKLKFPGEQGNPGKLKVTLISS